MARQRYTTTSPTFSNDFMFQAPWELAMSALQFNEKQVDTIYDQAQLLGDATANINFLEADRENINAEREVINAEINELTTALGNDPTQWKKHMPKIKQIGQNLQNNLRTGNLSKIQSSYNSYQNFLKNYEDLRKKDPQEFDRVSQYYLNQWRNTSDKGSLSSIFTPGAVYAPKALSDKEFVDILKDFKAEEFTTLDGLYKIDNKIVTKDQVAQAAINLATSNPDFANFIRQRQMIGDESYRTPMYMAVDNTTGQTLSAEEVEQRQQAFTNRALEIEKIFTNPTLRAQHTPQQLEEMKAELKPSFTTMLNPQNAIAQQANALGNVYSFKSQKISGNEPAIMMYEQGRQDARQARSIAATRANQEDRQAHEKEMLDKRHTNEQENIKLKAELNPVKGSTSGAKGKAKGEDTPANTISGDSYFPTWGTSIGEDLGFIRGEKGTPYERMIVNSKVATISSAATTAALANTNYKNDKDVKDILAFINKKVQQGDKGVIEILSEAKDNINSNTGVSKDLINLYFKEKYPQQAYDRSNWGKAALESVGKYGQIGYGGPMGTIPSYQDRSHIKTPTLNKYNSAGEHLDNLYSKLDGVVSTYTSEYTKRNDKLREPSSESKFFGLNTRSAETRQLQNNININLGDYEIFQGKDLLTPLTDVSEVKISGVTESIGGVPVAYIGKDSKGRDIRVKPNPKRAQDDLEYLSRNSTKILSPQDTTEGKVYLGMNGKIANIASAFSYLGKVGDNRQEVKLPTTSGKEIKLTKEIVNIKGQDKLKLKVSYPGKQPAEVLLDYKEQRQSDINSAKTFSEFIDILERENNTNTIFK